MARKERWWVSCKPDSPAGFQPIAKILFISTQTSYPGGLFTIVRIVHWWRRVCHTGVTAKG